MYIYVYIYIYIYIYMYVCIFIIYIYKNKKGETSWILLVFLDAFRQIFWRMLKLCYILLLYHKILLLLHESEFQLAALLRWWLATKRND